MLGFHCKVMKNTKVYFSPKWNFYYRLLIKILLPETYVTWYMLKISYNISTLTCFWSSMFHHITDTALQHSAESDSWIAHLLRERYSRSYCHDCRSRSSLQLYFWWACAPTVGEGEFSVLLSVFVFENKYILDICRNSCSCVRIIDYWSYFHTQKKVFELWTKV